MPRSDMIEAVGVVIDIQRGGLYRVLLDNDSGGADHEVLARQCGRMVMHHIKVILGDVVDLELSPYDLGKGRITYRRK
jgi:translation initiation factor IF-1